MGRRYPDKTVSVPKGIASPADTPSSDICEIEEECPHTVQYLGMCTNCGKDMTVCVGAFLLDSTAKPSC